MDDTAIAAATRLRANAELLGCWVREYLKRGYSIRDSVIGALKSVGVFEHATEEGIEKACALFTREVNRLKETQDEGGRIIRGVPTNISAKNGKKTIGHEVTQQELMSKLDGPLVIGRRVKDNEKPPSLVDSRGKPLKRIV